MSQIKEADILHTDAVGGSEKLTLGDLFQSLDAEKMKDDGFQMVEESEKSKGKKLTGD